VWPLCARAKVRVAGTPERDSNTNPSSTRYCHDTFLAYATCTLASKQRKNKTRQLRIDGSTSITLEVAEDVWLHQFRRTYCRLPGAELARAIIHDHSQISEFLLHSTHSHAISIARKRFYLIAGQWCSGHGHSNLRPTFLISECPMYMSTTPGFACSMYAN